MVRKKPKKAAKKTRERVVMTFHIEVDEAGNATVTANPNLKELKLAKDNFFSFTSNDPRTVIRFEGTSPIAEAPPGEIITVGTPGIGPFKRVNSSTEGHRFSCGFKNTRAPRGFSSWGRTKGGFPPPDDGGGH